MIFCIEKFDKKFKNVWSVKLWSRTFLCLGIVVEILMLKNYREAKTEEKKYCVGWIWLFCRADVVINVACWLWIIFKL